MDNVNHIEYDTLTLQAKKEHQLLIDDCYNASPDSMKSSIDVLNSYKNRRKIAILGTMNELGDESINAHKEVGYYAKDKVDLLIAIGNYKECYKDGFGLDNIITFEDKNEFIKNINTIIIYNTNWNCKIISLYDLIIINTF